MPFSIAAFKAGARPEGLKSYFRTLAQCSVPVYERSHLQYVIYCEDNGVEVGLPSLKAYFEYLHDEKKYAAKTLWTVLSHLRRLFEYAVLGEDGKGIMLKRDCPELEHFLKQWQKKEVIKSSAVFTKAEFEQVLLMPADTPEMLLRQTALVIGVFGVLRRAELKELRFQDIRFSGPTDDDVAAYVKIWRKKQVGPKRLSEFAIVGDVPLAILRRYINCFNTPDRKGCLFRKLLVSNEPNKFRGSKAVVGVNTLAAIPAAIARLLKKPDSECVKFTGHCYRRTGASILAESNCTLLELKQAGGWNSTTVAEHYIQASLVSKRVVARRATSVTS